MEYYCIGGVLDYEHFALCPAPHDFDAAGTYVPFTAEDVNLRKEGVTVTLSMEEINREPDEDPVNHPSHYKFDNGVEVIDLSEQLSFNLGNVVKYVSRAGKKEDQRQDLEKAQWYLQRELDRLRYVQQDGE